MRTIRYTRQFRKDFKRIKRRRGNPDTLKRAVALLAENSPLPPSCRDHPLIGNYIGTRECHLQPDWLLIYTYADPDELILIRTGTHAGLFNN